MTAILKALQGHGNSVPPIWLMRQAGRYLPEYRTIRQKISSFMDLCFHEEQATEVTLQPIQRFDFDAAILFCDILVIPYALGQSVHFQETKGPILDKFDPLTFFDKAKDINISEALSTPLKIIQNVRNYLPKTKSLIGFAGSPWTVATYMLEGGKSVTFDHIKSLLMTRDPLYTQTMQILEKSIGSFLVEQIKAGADVVQIFDSWAKAVPSQFQQEWIVNPTRRIISRIHIDYPDTPIIYYGRGVSSLYPEIAKGFSNVAFGVDENVPLSTMKDELQQIAPVQGNLSPQVLVDGGDEMKSMVLKLLNTFRETPYIFNLGHGVLPITPIDNVSRLVDIVREGEV